MNQKPSSILFRQRLELLLITQRGDILNRAKEIIHQYHMSFKNFDNFEDVGRDSSNAQVVLIAQEENEALGTFSHRVEAVLSRFPKAWIVTVLHDSSLQENLEGTQFDRVVPLSPGEFFSTLKLDFICLLRARSQYFEFPVTDLFPMTTLSFSVFVRLELNRRYLTAGFKNVVLSESKFQKLGHATSLYFQLNEGVDYYQHIIKYFDTSGTGFKKRVRAVFLSICAVWLRIQEYLLFDYKKTSSEMIEQQFAALQEQIAHLLELMDSSALDDMWEIFREALNNDLLNEFRAPWFGAYAGFMAIKSKKGDPKTAFLAAQIGRAHV